MLFSNKETTMLLEKTKFCISYKPFNA